MRITAALPQFSHCDYMASVDADTYLRPFQALAMLQRVEQHAADNVGDEVYVGHIWDARSTGRPNVVTDPDSPWFLNYTGKYYPPYASGYAYILSSSLWRRVADCLDSTARPGPEDVQVGICVQATRSSSTRIVSPHEMRYTSPCTSATVADNAACAGSRPFNLYQRHEAMLQGKFCGLGPRRLASGRQYGALVVVCVRQWSVLASTFLKVSATQACLCSPSTQRQSVAAPTRPSLLPRIRRGKQPLRLPKCGGSVRTPQHPRTAGDLN